MAKVSKKSEKITAFGGIFFVLDKFDRILSSVIDSHLGLRSKLVGYQYSEIIRAVFSVFCCGGDCMEDLNLYLKDVLAERPHTRIPSADTVLRGIEELATENISYTSEKTGNVYDFNTAESQSLSTLRGKGKVSAYKSSSSVSKPRVRQNRHKQGLNQTIEKLSADFRVKRKMSIFASSESTTLPVRTAYQGGTFLFIATMKYNKQPLDIPTQIAMLKGRGLNIVDEQAAEKTLSRISYFL